MDMKTRDLDQREDTGNDQGRGDHVLLHFRRDVHATGTTHDQGWRNNTGKHSQTGKIGQLDSNFLAPEAIRVLETQKESQHNRHSVIQTKKGSGLSGTLHEREIRSEEESIVVITEQAIPGRKSVREASQVVANRLPGARLGDNLVGAVILIHVGNCKLRVCYRGARIG